MTDRDDADKEAAIEAVQEQLRNLSARFRQAMREAAAQLDPTLQPAALSLLRLVHQHPGMSAGCAAHELMADPSSVSRLIRQLVDLGLLRADIDPADRRARVLTLSDGGQQVIDRVLPAIRTSFGAELRGWDTADLTTFAALLGRLVNVDQGVSTRVARQ